MPGPPIHEGGLGTGCHLRNFPIPAYKTIPYSYLGGAGVVAVDDVCLLDVDVPLGQVVALEEPRALLHLQVRRRALVQGDVLHATDLHLACQEEDICGQGRVAGNSNRPTELAKKVGPRLRELAPRPETGSRNLGQTFLAISVQ